MTSNIFLSLGSSVGNAADIFTSTETFLANHGIMVIKKSTILKNPPMGDRAKNEFSNAVWEAELLTGFEKGIRNQELGIRNREQQKTNPIIHDSYFMILCDKLLKILKSCEQIHGRDHQAPRWSDRPLDIDILMWGNLTIETNNITIPHPGIPTRNFVLKPWIEISGPDFFVPEMGTLGEMMSKLKDKS